MVGAEVAGPTPAVYNGLEVEQWPLVSWSPSFAQVRWQRAQTRRLFGRTTVSLELVVTVHYSIGIALLVGMRPYRCGQLHSDLSTGSGSCFICRQSQRLHDALHVLMFTSMSRLCMTP